MITVKQQLKKLSKEGYLNLKELSHIAKNLYNAPKGMKTVKLTNYKRIQARKSWIMTEKN